MEERRQIRFRRRSPSSSPHKPVTGIGQPRTYSHSHGRFTSLVRPELEPSRPVGSSDSRDYKRQSQCDNEDEYRDGRSRKLSEFNHAMPGRESTSTKYQWDHLFAQKQVPNMGCHHSNCVKMASKSMECDRDFRERERETFSYSTVVTAAAKDYDLRPMGNCDLGLQNSEASGMQSKHIQHVNVPGFSKGLVKDGVGHDGCGRTPGFNLPAKSKLQGNEFVDFTRPWMKGGDSVPCNGDSGSRYFKAQGSKWCHFDRCDDQLYRKKDGVQDERRRQNVRRCSLVDSIVDKVCSADSSSSRDGVRESADSRMLDNGPSLLGQRCLNFISTASHMMDRDGEDMGCGHTDYKAQVYIDHEKHPLQEDNGFRPHEDIYSGDLCETEGSHQQVLTPDDRSHEDMYYVDVYETEGNQQEMLTANEVRIQDSLPKMLKRNLMLHLKTVGENPNNNLPNDQSLNIDGNHDLSCGVEQWTNEDIQQLQPSEGWRHENSPVERTGRIFDEIVNHSNDWTLAPDVPVSTQQHSSEPVKIYRVSVKERLGPARRNVKQRLGPAIKDIKKRLGPTQKFPKTNPWVANLISARENLYDIDDGFDVQGADSPKVELKRAKMISLNQGSELLELKAKQLNTEPREGSEEFKQLVHINFLKFVKALNENSALRRRYTGQEGADILKCIVCGRNSKEFVDTVSLVQHTFASRLVGCRGEHLGFHKALCVLMGWNSKAATHNSWIPQVLPDVDALVLKEDLIIWPPIVVIHNSSIASCNPDERVIIGTEELSAILGDMGFSRGFTKVCRGRPANQSIMVVSFEGTFSGLKEAERLHMFYAQNKLGRADFMRIEHSRSNNCNGEKQIVAAKEVESILYGYLGIADDLVKLDFRTKKHSVVKSRQEIQGLAAFRLHS